MASHIQELGVEIRAKSTVSKCDFLWVVIVLFCFLFLFFGLFFLFICRCCFVCCCLFVFSLQTGR